MSQAVTRFLNLRPGDLSRGWPFFVYLSLIIASYVMGQVCSTALFANQFGAAKLAYGNIAIAAMVGGVIALYLRISRRINLKNLLTLCLVFLSANAFVFWWVAHFYRWPWIYPLLYVWVGIFGVLAPTQVWTLGNFVWNTREAKRMFTLLGSGAIVGGIWGGWLAKVVPGRYGAESLLLIASVFVILCAGLVQIIWRQWSADRADGGIEPQDDSPKRSLRDSLRVIRQSTLLQSIALLICVASITATLAGWQYAAVASSVLKDKNTLTAFLGSVTFYTGLLSLGAQILLTSRVLKNFGIGVALFVLPTALLTGSIGLLLSGSLVAASMLRASDKVLRYSVDKSSMELLYLPIPAEVKLQAKSFVDTVVWRLGDGLAGLTVVILADKLGFSAREVVWVNLIFLAVWFSLVVVARRQYVATLSSNMQQLQLHPQHNSAPVLDAVTTNVFVSKLNSQDPGEILYALELFELGQDHGSHSVVRRLVEHPSPEIRKKAVAVLNAAGDKNARATIAPLLRDGHIEVRTEALLYMMRHHNIDPLQHVQEIGDFADYSIRSATIAYLARPGEAENIDAARLMLDAMVREDGPQGQRTRLEAARLIGGLPDHFAGQLSQLLHDSDAAVVQQAIRSVGMLRKRKFAPLLIEHLNDPQVRDETVDALLAFEDSVVGTLRDYLNDSDVSIEIRREIPAVLVGIGTPEAMRSLGESLIAGDNVLRYRIIAGLNKLAALHDDVRVDRETVETVLLAEITGHYRSYQILASANGDPVEALRESMKEELERIFRLMKLLSPDQDLQGAYLGLQSTDPVRHANALEFLDATLKPQLRNLLVPLIDSEVSESERATLADKFLHIRVNTREEALAALRSSDDPWLKACAALWETRNQS
jgi:ATP:ADP antiporter, AAA family